MERGGEGERERKKERVRPLNEAPFRGREGERERGREGLALPTNIRLGWEKPAMNKHSSS
jgi:hypothetical protein